MILSKIFVILFIMLENVACITALEESAPSAPVVQAQTIVEVSPKSPDQVVSKQDVTLTRKFSLSILDARKIVRRRVELREGPGAAYFVNDIMLEHHEVVIVLEKYFRWRKVLAVQKKVQGWVHEKTISPHKLKDGESEIELSYFPKIFPRKDIKRVFDYSTSKKVPFEIPEGTKLKKLRQDKKRILILIEKTNSVAWVNEGDII